jgi:glycosyltransferase involved in cell wall biosynthesis
VEAQSCGTPIIGYRKGGLLETVIENKTGVFFDNQTTDDIIKAVELFETKKFNPEEIRKNAERYSKERFEKEFKEFVEKKIKEH